MRKDLGFLRVCVVVTIYDILDVTINLEAAYMFGIIPVEIDTGNFGAFPIFGDCVVWLEVFAQVVNMALDNLFYTNIVNDKDKDYGVSFVAPKARGGGILVVSFCVEAISEELVGKHAGLE